MIFSNRPPWAPAFNMILLTALSLFGWGCALTHQTAKPEIEPPSLVDQSLSPRLETGDLIFLDLDCGELCDAIETVTLEQFEVSEPRLSHMGVVLREDGQMNIIEAWPDGGVQKTPVTKFLARVKGGENQINGYYIGHFKNEFRDEAARAANAAKQFLGRSYDDEFLTTNDKYYCSELIAEAFNKADSPWFKYRGMYFGNSSSPAYSIWKKYFDEKKLPIPTNKLGISPLGIYLAGRAMYFE